jgi:hypothetical protein
MRKLDPRVLILPAIIVVAAFVFSAVTVFAIATPVNFQTNAISTCLIRATWNTVTGADHYMLESSPNTSLTPAKFRAVPSSSRPIVTYDVSELAPNTHLYFQVAAVDTAGDYSAYSPTTDATTRPTPATSTPKLTAAAGQYGNKQIRIDFATTTSLSQYGGWEIQYGTSTNGTNFSPWQTISGQVTPWDGTYYVDNGNGLYLNPSLAYEYRVRNYNSDLGCSTDWYSDYSSPIIVPAIPTGFSAKYHYDVNMSPPNIISLAWNASAGADHYEVLRDGNDGQGYVSVTSTTVTSFTDDNIQTSHQYTYKVRAYNSADPNLTGYSDFTPPVKVNTGGAPQNFKANVSNVYQDANGNTAADIALSWDNTYPIDPPNGQPGSNYYVYEAIGVNATTSFTQIGVMPPSATSVATISTSTTVATGPGKGYTFCVSAKIGTVFTPCSTPVSIDTNLVSLKNYAWTAYTPNGGGGGQVGIGAISFSSANEISPTVPYGVFMNNTTGALSGYAWAGDSPDYGWLSFNASDVQNCPPQSQAHTLSSNCAPTVDKNGDLTGWARFIGASSSLGAWDGWVSLSGYDANIQNKYKVHYDSSTENFSGEAWGGDVVGWISFCDTAPFASGANRYCVTTGSTAPTIIATSSTANSITITWKNPISYSKVEFYQTYQPNLGQLAIQDKGNYRVYRTFYATNASDTIYTNATSSISYTISNVSSSATYGIFIRGYQ